MDNVNIPYDYYITGQYNDNIEDEQEKNLEKLMADLEKSLKDSKGK